MAGHHISINLVLSRAALGASEGERGQEEEGGQYYFQLFPAGLRLLDFIIVLSVGAETEMGKDLKYPILNEKFSVLFERNVFVHDLLHKR